MNVCIYVHNMHDVYNIIMCFYVFMSCKYAYVCFRCSYFVVCLKQGIVGVSETCRLLLKFTCLCLYCLWKKNCNNILNCTVVLVFFDKNLFGVIC